MKKIAIVFFLSYFTFLDCSLLADNTQKADSIKESLKDLSGKEKLEALIELSETFFEFDTKSSIKVSQQALILAEKLKDDRGKFRTLYQLGKAYRGNAQNRKALDYMFKTLQFAESKKFEEELGNIFYQLVRVYFNLNYIDKALKYSKLSYESCNKFGNVSGEMRALIAIGLCYQKKEKYDEALKYFKQCLEIAKRNENSKMIFSTCINIGNVYNDKKDLSNANRYYFKAEKYYKNTWSFLDAPVEMNLALAYGRDKKNKIALEHFKNAWIIAEKFNSAYLKKSYYLCFSQYYVGQNDYKKAYKYTEKVMQIKDSLHQIELADKISSIEAKILQNEELVEKNNMQKMQIKRQRIYQLFGLCTFLLTAWLLHSRYKNKKKDNELLYLKNNVITRQKQELVEVIKKLKKSENNLRITNTTKNKMLSLISHDLRGSIGNISKGLKMLIGDKKLGMTDEEKQNFQKTLYNSASGSFEVLENLLYWAQNQSGNIIAKKEYVELNTILSSCISTLTELAKIKSIKLFNHSNSSVNVFVDSDMINTVLRNIISNAIKFTHENGTIEVKTKILEKNVEIFVMDNGIGMTQEQLKNIHMGKTIRGTVGEKGTGLGLAICCDFLEKNNGKLRVESQLHKGTTFSFTIPREGTNTEEKTEIQQDKIFISS